MLRKLNIKLENLGESLRGSIKYDFNFSFDKSDFLTTKFIKELIVTDIINKNLYKKLK